MPLSLHISLVYGYEGTVFRNCVTEYSHFNVKLILKVIRHAEKKALQTLKRIASLVLTYTASSATWRVSRVSDYHTRWWHQSRHRQWPRPLRQSLWPSDEGRWRWSAASWRNSAPFCPGPNHCGPDQHTFEATRLPFPSLGCTTQVRLCMDKCNVLLFHLSMLKIYNFLNLIWVFCNKQSCISSWLHWNCIAISSSLNGFIFDMNKGFQWRLGFCLSLIFKLRVPVFYCLPGKDVLDSWK